MEQQMMENKYLTNSLMMKVLIYCTLTMHKVAALQWRSEGRRSKSTQTNRCRRYEPSHVMEDVKLTDKTNSIDFHASKDVIETLRGGSACEISHLVFKKFLGNLYDTSNRESDVEEIKVDFSLLAEMEGVIKKVTILINRYESVKKA